MATRCFQCPECGYGNYEVGHLTDEAELHCIVCLEEHGLRVQVCCWEEHQAVLADPVGNLDH